MPGIRDCRACFAATTRPLLLATASGSSQAQLESRGIPQWSRRPPGRPGLAGAARALRVESPSRPGSESTSPTLRRARPGLGQRTSTGPSRTSGRLPPPRASLTASELWALTAAPKQPEEAGAHDSDVPLAKQQPAGASASAEEARRTKETKPPARDPREPEGPYRNLACSRPPPSSPSQAAPRRHMPVTVAPAPEEQFHCFDAVTVSGSLPPSMPGLSSQNDPTDIVLST
jgi:hypothetical protein